MTRHGFRTLAALLLVAPLASCGGGHPGTRPTAHRRTRPTAHRSTPDPPTTAAARAAPGAPRQVVLAPPQALVTDETQNRLVVVDLPGGRIVRRLPLPPDPEDIYTVGNGGVVIVVSSQAGKVSVLNRDTLRTIRTFRGFDQPHIVAISPDGRYAYITDDARGTLTVIRLSDMRVTSTVYVGAGAHHLSFSPDEQRVWVALGESATQIAVLNSTDPAHPRVIGRFDPGFPAHDVAFTTDGRVVLVSSSSGPDATAFDAESHHVRYRVAVGPPPQHIAVDGRYAYLTSGYGRTIEKVDTSTGQVLTRAAAPYGSFELSAADGFVTTASLLRGTLAIYSSALKPLRTVNVAPATREVAISRP